jgi:hypothetical protein
MIKKSINWFESNFLISFIIAILIAIVIFYLSSIPASGYPGGLGITTKIYHIGIFFLLSLFLMLAIVKGKTENKQLIYLAIIISIFYGLTDEAHQLFVQGRTSAVTDVLIDSLGVLSAGIIYAIRMNFLRNIK